MDYFGQLKKGGVVICLKNHCTLLQLSEGDLFCMARIQDNILCTKHSNTTMTNGGEVEIRKFGLCVSKMVLNRPKLYNMS